MELLVTMLANLLATDGALLGAGIAALTGLGAGIGMGVPGPVDTARGIMCLSSNLYGFTGYPIVQHLQENDKNIIGLLSCESCDIFLRYFKDSLNDLVQSQFVNQNRKTNTDIPQDFLINHISSSFVEMVLWWIKNRMKQTPMELDHYFRAVIEPIL